MHIQLPRMTQYVIFALLLFGFIAWAAPENLPVIIYKLGIVTSAGFVGYWLDRHLFPYARPHTFLSDQATSGGNGQGFIGATIRRAIIVAATVIGFAIAT